MLSSSQDIKPKLTSKRSKKTDHFSKADRKRGLIIPEKLTNDLAEFVRVLIGDGYIYTNGRQNVIGIVGNPKTDQDYFDYLSQLSRKLFGIMPSIKVVGRGLRLFICSQGLFYYLTNEIGLPCGKEKHETVNIPSCFLDYDSLSDKVLRGLFDTDDSIFTSNKKGAPNYPCIELTTTSIKLAKTVKTLLGCKGFNVAGVRTYQYKNPNSLLSHKVSLYGNRNLFLWYINIGFSNPLKRDRLRTLIKEKNGATGI